MIQKIKNLALSPNLLLAMGITLLCIALQYADLDDLLRFERLSIKKGHWWLLLTGNFVHLGYSHLWMNMAGFALIVALVWHHYSVKEWVVIVLLSSLCVGLGLFILNPEVHAYVGFSGTLHGLIFAGCLADLKSYPKSAGLLLILVTGKLAVEQFSGALPGSESVAGGLVLVDSHLYGAVGGAVIGLLVLAWRYRSSLHQLNKRS